MPAAASAAHQDESQCPSGLVGAGPVDAGDSRPVELELLVVPDCPNEAAAVAAVQAAARQAGLGEGGLRVTVIGTDEQARGHRFAGSPTLLIDGVDPFADPSAPIGLTCRIYSTTDGPAGVPELAQLRAALVRACASRSTAAGG